MSFKDIALVKINGAQMATIRFRDGFYISVEDKLMKLNDAGDGYDTVMTMPVPIMGLDILDDRLYIGVEGV